jgi:hypothetical protein
MIDKKYFSRKFQIALIMLAGANLGLFFDKVESKEYAAIIIVVGAGYGIVNYLDKKPSSLDTSGAG